jgi:predicted nuclease with TOPRIM domain
MEPIVYVVVIGGFLVVLMGIAAFGSLAAGKLRLRQLEAARTEGTPRELEDAVEQLQRRVAELEERQDFAERLLAQAQAREKGQLGPGNGK